MNRITRLLTLCFCFSLIACGLKTKNSSDVRIDIDFSKVNVIEIRNIPLGKDTSATELKQLTTEQSKQFIEKWNSSESVGLCESVPHYLIFVTFNDGSKRTFRLKGQTITENNDYGYSIDNRKFFDNLWVKSSSVLKKKNKTFILLQGRWFNEDDSLASLTIINYDCFFHYGREQTGMGLGSYQISLTDKLPQFLEKSENPEFIVVTNKTDTMYYGVLGFDDKISLMDYTTKKTHLYKREK